MKHSVVSGGRTDIRAWAAFLTGVLVCVFLFSYGEIRKNPSGLLTLDVSTTHPGLLKVIYTKDGVLVDPGWTINFPQGKTSQIGSFPLSPGNYELIGFKPLVEAGGVVSVKNLKIISGAGVSDINVSGFVAINQLTLLGTKNSEAIFSPAAGANDPFGAIPGLHELVPKAQFAPVPFLWLVVAKLSLVVLFVSLMYGLSGSLPFATGIPNQPYPEPGLPHWIGMLAVGLIVLYLRNANSLLVPILYTEDGVWSAGLINRGFIDMLFNAKEGHARYFVFGNILLLALAHLANTAFFGHDLSNLPHFVSLISMLFYSALAAAPVFLLREVMRIEARILLWFLVLLVPLGDSSFEIFGRLSNVGFAFLFLAFCLLVWRRYTLHDNDRKRIVAADAMLFVCANTNPLCYPLIVINFFAVALGHWNVTGQPRAKVWIRNYLAKFSAKSALSLLSLLLVSATWMILREKGTDSFLTGDIESSNLIEALIPRSILFPFVFPIYTFLNNAISIVLLLSLFAVGIFILLKAKKEKITLISAVVVLIAASVVTIMTRPGLTSVLDNFRTSSLDRYYFGLSLFVLLAFSCSLSVCFRCATNSVARSLGILMAGSIIAFYVSNYPYLFEFSKTRWFNPPTATFRDDVNKAYQNGGEAGSGEMRYQVDLHPKPWVTHFPESYVASTALGIRFLPANMAIHRTMTPAEISETAQQYEGKVIKQTPAGRGRDDGWFYVSGGARSWIPDAEWLKTKGLSATDVIEINSKEFSSIPDSGRPVN